MHAKKYKSTMYLYKTVMTQSSVPDTVSDTDLLAMIENTPEIHEQLYALIKYHYVTYDGGLCADKHPYNIRKVPVKGLCVDLHSLPDSLQTVIRKFVRLHMDNVGAK